MIKLTPSCQNEMILSREVGELMLDFIICNFILYITPVLMIKKKAKCYFPQLQKERKPQTLREEEGGLF